MEQQTNILPIIAILLSTLSLIIVALNYLNAKASFKISKKQFINKQENFSLYLNDNYYIIKNDIKYALFHITIINKADSKNSFVPKLEINYVSENDYVSRVIVDYNNNTLVPDHDVSLTFFENNILCGEKESSTKWLIFKIPHKLKNKIIDKYSIVFKDSNNNIASVESFILKELPHEN